MSFIRKSNRLVLDEYKEPYRFYLTLCTDNRQHIFTDKSLVEKLIKVLRDVSQESNWKIHAFCFMPDHLHLLVEPIDYDLDLIKFVSLFKQKSGYWYKRNYSQSLWQRSFFDHVLRGDESTENVIRYIFENPVKVDLVENWRDYPFLGSFIYNIDEL